MTSFANPVRCQPTLDVYGGAIADIRKVGRNNALCQNCQVLPKMNLVYVFNARWPVKAKKLSVKL